MFIYLKSIFARRVWSGVECNLYACYLTVCNSKGGFMLLVNVTSCSRLVHYCKVATSCPKLQLVVFNWSMNLPFRLVEKTVVAGTKHLSAMPYQHSRIKRRHQRTKSRRGPAVNQIAANQRQPNVSTFPAGRDRSSTSDVTLLSVILGATPRELFSKTFFDESDRKRRLFQSTPSSWTMEKQLLYDGDIWLTYVQSQSINYSSKKKASSCTFEVSESSGEKIESCSKIL